MTLNELLKYAQKGCYFLPCRRNSKLPAIKDFNERASNDPKQLEDWVAQYENFGLLATRFKSDRTLVIVDVDVSKEKKKDGKATLDKLEKIPGQKFPDTYIQTTPTGGLHLVYQTKRKIKQGSNVLGPGVDIRAQGGYVVFAGSVIDGRRYTSNGRDIERAPEWLLKLLSDVDKPKEPLKTTTAVLDTTSITARAIHYLTKEASLAFEGEGGDQTTFKVAAKLRDFGLSELDAFSLMFDHWNKRCEPPWPVEQLQVKVENAYNYSGNAPGVDAPENMFEMIEVEPDTAEPKKKEKDFRQEINDKYALVFTESSHCILEETVDEEGNAKRKFISEQTFRRRFSNQLVKVKRGDTDKFISKAALWLDWSKRREYNGLCFAPEREVNNGYFNLWSGFTCKPLSYELAPKRARKGFDLWREHIKENIASGDDKIEAWILGYFAHMIQRPYVKPLTTMVLRGLKGSGKNAMVDRVGRLLGSRHYLVAHDGRYLTSRFNAHLDSCLCLVLDEAFWSGDKAAEGQLKGLTTAPKILIERKGEEIYAVTNLVRLIVIGNDDWLIPASHEERRYAVFDVGDGRLQDNKFFDTMVKGMDEQGGDRILLDYLQNYDLVNVDVNTAIKTQGLLDQQKASLGPLHRYWLECLEEGRIIGVDFDEDGAWPEEIEKATFTSAFKRYCDQAGIRTRIPTMFEMTKNLRKACCSFSESRPRRDDGARPYCFAIPPLWQARTEWDQFMRQNSKWK